MQNYIEINEICHKIVEIDANLSKLTTFEKLWLQIETQILQTKMYHTKAQQIFNIQRKLPLKQFSEITQQIQLKRQFSHPKVRKRAEPIAVRSPLQQYYSSSWA